MSFVCEECDKGYKHLSSLTRHTRQVHGEADGEADSTQMKRKPDRMQNENQPKKRKVETQEDLSCAVSKIQTEMLALRKEVQAMHQVMEDFKSSVEAILSVMEGRMVMFDDAVQNVTRKNMKWCVVCFEKENEYAFMPCRHKCVCRECAKEVAREFRQCPICRRSIEAICKIHDLSAWDGRQSEANL